MKCMSRRSGDKVAGLTLVEVLVAGFLASLVLYILITLLVPTVRMSALGTTRVDLDQRGAVITQRLVDALRRTTRAGVATGSQEGATLVSIHPLAGALAGSKQSWSDSLTVFSWSDETLQERKLSLESPPNKAAVLPLAQLSEELPKSDLRLEIRDVKEFSLTIDSGPRVDFRLVLSKANDVLTLERTVFLVNSSQ